MRLCVLATCGGLFTLAGAGCDEPCPRYMDGWEVGVEHGRECVGTVQDDGSLAFPGWGGGTYPAWCSWEYANYGYWNGYCQGETTRIHEGQSTCGALGDEACLQAYGTEE